MKNLHVMFLAGILIVVVGGTAPMYSQDASKAKQTAVKPTGAHDFDFLFGEWRVHHRIKTPVENQPWVEFDGTSSNRPLMDGSANVEDNTFNKPNGISRGVAIRAYDPKTGLWAIWWIDGRDPSGAMDPPVKGSFVNGVGTFYSDGPIGGKPARTRFIWSRITPTSARWEQAYSFDSGKTWETNWIMDFGRVH
jgi:hypothetical protein